MCLITKCCYVAPSIVVILRAVKLNVILLAVTTLSVVMLCVIMSNVIVLSPIMLIVMLGIYLSYVVIVQRYAGCHYIEHQCTKGYEECHYSFYSR